MLQKERNKRREKVCERKRLVVTIGMVARVGIFEKRGISALHALQNAM